MTDVFDAPPTPEKIKEETTRLTKRLRALREEQEHLVRSLRFFRGACKHKYEQRYVCTICGHDNE